MSDDDLIRRGDAIVVLPGPRHDFAPYQDAVAAIRALPAVQPSVKPLEWLQHPTRLGELFADAEFGAYSVSDPTGRGCWQWQWHLMGALLDQSNQELARAFPTRGDAIAAAEGHRKARILSALEPAVQPDAAAIRGAAPRRASGPIDPEAGFATSGAEARWIGDVDAGVYDDDPEEIGILQARVEDQDRKIADLTRQLQGQPRRQSDVVAGAADYDALRQDIRNMVELYEIYGEEVSLAVNPESAGRALSYLDTYECRNWPSPRILVEDSSIVLTWEIGNWKLYQYCDDKPQKIFRWTGTPVAGAAPVSVGPTLPRCECGMTGPCAWAECRSPNLAQKGDSHE
jgi:hypothetical protein